MASVTYSVLLPLMMVVVGQLAATARDIDLKTIEPDDDVHLLDAPGLRWVADGSLRLPALLSTRDHGGVPQFGRLNQIHAYNSVLLGASHAFNSLTGTGRSTLLLGVLIVVFWAVVPLIEVDEYDDMMRTFDRADSVSSYSTHVFTTLALGVAGFGFHVLAGAHWLEQTAAFLAYVVAVVLSANLYQVHLDREIACLREKGADESAATESGRV